MRKLWLIFIAIFVFSFAILGWVGTEIFRQAPPIPREVVTTDGQVLIAAEEISNGQNVWQAMGGMESGSIWGHGSYVAPDWSADYLHREALFILNEWSQKDFSNDYDNLASEQKAVLRQRLQDTVRKNNYDEASGRLTIEPVRARAFEDNLKHYTDVFTNGKTVYAVQRNAQPDPAKLRQLNSFFFWTSWASATNRPNNTISYTSNFPSEPLVGNVPTSSAIVWTGVSVIMLLAGIGWLVWYYASRETEMVSDDVPDNDPLIGAQISPSQKATVKYFLVVTLLFLLQIAMGMLTAHYGVEGGGFFGIPLADYLPYVVTRTWHTQLGIFWIATAWLAAGLFIAPFICGYEPKRQKLGVDVLFGALLIVVLGSMAGQWMSVMHMLPGSLWFWFGHQGYEYVDLGQSLASGALCRFALVAFPDCASCDSCAEEKGHTAISDHSLLFVDGRNRAVLQPGTFLGNALASFRRRVLALVGRASVGRRVLRGFCDGSHCVPVRQAARHSCRERRAGSTAFRRDLFKRRNYRHASSLVFFWNSNSGDRLRLGV